MSNQFCFILGEKKGSNMQEPGHWSGMPYAEKYDLGYCHSVPKAILLIYI